MWRVAGDAGGGAGVVEVVVRAVLQRAPPVQADVVGRLQWWRG